MSLNDPEFVAGQYETEAGLRARKAVYENVSGADARQIVLDLVLAGHPGRILEVGCGEGELAERVLQESEATVVAVDQSERMVELTRARGVDARVADVQELPFPDESFDVVLAGWMLYHVADVERGIAEIARVLAPRGRLVAATNASDHLIELLALGGVERWTLPFGAENAADSLSEHFDVVERIDVGGEVTFSDIELVRSYFGSSERLAPALERLPVELAEPLVARRRPVVFVATKGSA